MAMLAQGIVGGNMAWPLVIVGILMGFALIMVEVKSPMLFSVGMYLPRGDHLRDLRWRRYSLDHRQDARPARSERCAEGARGQCRRADRFRPDRRRSALRTGDRRRLAGKYTAAATIATRIAAIVAAAISWW